MNGQRSSDTTDRTAAATDELARNERHTTRRGVLAGVMGLGLAGLAGTAGASVDSDPQTMAFSNHDHSGQNGARNVLGADAPVSSIAAEEISGTRYASAYGTDGQAIQDAIDNAGGSAEWSRIVVDPIDSAPYAVGSGAPIEVPSKTVIELREDVQLTAGTQENVFQNENFETDGTDDSDIVFVGAGGTIDGNRANISPGSGYNHASGFYQNGISILGADRVQIRNVTVIDCVHHGINFAAVRHGTITECECRNNRFSGVHAHFRESDDTRNEHLVINDNICRDGGQAAAHGGGIFLSGSRDIVVDGNLVRNRDNHGIGVFAGASALGASDVTITGNTVTDVGAVSNSYIGRGAGIFLWAGNTGNGVENVTIADNAVDTTGASDNEQVGIYCRAEDEPVERVSISGNTVRTQGNAIFLDGSADAPVKKFSISGNSVTTTTFAYAKGIAVKDAVYGTVSGNTAKNCQGSGIILWKENYGASNVLVTGNLSHDGGNSQAGAAGIRLYGATHCTVIGNRCTDTGVGYQEHGIREEQSAAHNVYLHNDLRYNEVAATDFSGGSGQITDPVNQDTTEDYNIT